MFRMLIACRFGLSLQMLDHWPPKLGKDISLSVLRRVFLFTELRRVIASKVYHCNFYDIKNIFRVNRT